MKKLILGHLTLIIVVVILFIPYIIALLNSFNAGDNVSLNIIPTSFTLDHWKQAFGISYIDQLGNVVEAKFPVFIWIFNSVKVALLSTILILFSSLSMAYALSRMKFRSRGKIILALLYLQLFPGMLSAVAYYYMFNYLGAFLPFFSLNSHWSIILAYTSGVPYFTILLRGYFNSIPKEIEEAAIIDRANTWTRFVKIMVPLVIPIAISAFIIAFILALTEYPIANALLTQDNKLTLGVAYQFYLVETRVRWGDIMAVALLSGVPIAFVFVMIQNKIRTQNFNSAVKG